MTIHFYHASDAYGFLSNFAPVPIVLDGMIWPTTEHHFQAQKFLDPATQRAIRNAATPGEAKKLGRAPGQGFRRDWGNVRDAVMLAALRAKFTQHHDLRVPLLASGDSLLIERAYKDSYWGDGGDGSGRNRLGQLLMQVRTELGSQAG